MKYQSVIFDSEKDNWKKESSVFDDKVLKQEKLAFVIETTDGHYIGIYLHVRVFDANKWIKVEKKHCGIYPVML